MVRGIKLGILVWLVVYGVTCAMTGLVTSHMGAPAAFPLLWLMVYSIICPLIGLTWFGIYNVLLIGLVFVGMAIGGIIGLVKEVTGERQ